MVGSWTTELKEIGKSVCNNEKRAENKAQRDINIQDMGKRRQRKRG